MTGPTLFGPELESRAADLVTLYRRLGLKIATAESCTGGLVAGLIVGVPGSSAVLERGFVTYSNEAKVACLGVPEALLAAHGAVSAEVARAMAEGAVANGLADVGVAVTGVAGPDGGSAEKPVGLVHFACARRGGAVLHVEKRYGDLGRLAVRLASVGAAFDLLFAAAD